ncbi:MAG: type II toxin-antitoxin system VapC family toxin [Thermoanaerobaculia bacterium]
MIHLDTSCAIDLLRETRRGENGPATRFVSALDLQEVVISLFVQCELFVGAELSQRVSQTREEILRFCSRVSVVYPDQRFPRAYSVLLSALRRSRQEIGMMDVLIATQALVEGALLVTRNVKHFERVPDLRILTY